MKHLRLGALGGLAGGVLFALAAAGDGGWADALHRLPGTAAAVAAVAYSAGIYGLLGMLAGLPLGAGVGIALGLAGRAGSSRAAASLHGAAGMAAGAGIHIVLIRLQSVPALVSVTDPARIRQGLLGAGLTLILLIVLWAALYALLGGGRAAKLASGRALSAVLAGAAALALAASLAMAGILGAGGGEAGAAPPSRLLVIGLDGTGWNTLRPLLRKGRLPALGALVGRGLSGTMRVHGPVHYSDWTTMVSGTYPSRHGITRSFIPEEDGYGFIIARSDQRHGPTLWTMAGDAGRKVGVANWMVTTPPETVNGFMFSDKVIPGEARAYPPGVTDAMAEAGLPLEPDLLGWCRRQDFPRRADELLGQISGNLEVLKDQTVWLYEQHRPELFFTHVLSVDNVQHLFWKFRYPEEFDASWGVTPGGIARYRGAIARVFAQADEWVAELVERAGPDAMVVVLSDHGIRPNNFPQINLKINALLEKLGYLTFRDPSDPEALAELNDRARYFQLPPFPQGVDQRGIIESVPDQFLFAWMDPGRTRAFSAGTRNYESVSGVRLNVRGREPEGIVEPGGEFAELQAELIRRLSELRLEDGTPLFNGVFLPEEETDPAARRLGYDLTMHLGAPTRESAGDKMVALGDELRFPLDEVLEEEESSSTHRMQGIFIAAGPGIRSGTLTFWSVDTPFNFLLRRFSAESRPGQLLWRFLRALRLAEPVEAADWAPTMLHALGMESSRQFDGRVIEEAFAR